MLGTHSWLVMADIRLTDHTKNIDKFLRSAKPRLKELKIVSIGYRSGLPLIISMQTQTSDTN